MKLYYSRDARESAVYEVEVFGTITTNKGIELVIHRESCHWVQLDVGEVVMLPKDEFERKYAKFEEK